MLPKNNFAATQECTESISAKFSLCAQQCTYIASGTSFLIFYCRPFKWPDIALAPSYACPRHNFKSKFKLANSFLITV